MIPLLLIVALSYLIGSIPGSLWVGKGLYGVDLRRHGSGNPGATNAFRVLGWKAGLLSTVIDMGKGYVAAGLIPGLVQSIGIGWVPAWITGGGAQSLVLGLFAGAAAVLGHMFPVWARFKGGKGVNTAAGILIAVTPLNMLIVFVVFCLVLWRSSYVSLASITAAIAYPVSLAVQRFALGHTDISNGLFIFSICLATAIVAAHHSNIKRLVKGTENKMSWVKSPVVTSDGAH